MQHIVPVIDDVEYNFASHFFPRFNKCFFANQNNGVLTLSVDPTKLLPKKRSQKDVQSRLELSVILHVLEDDILWEVGEKLYAISGMAQCCADFRCDSCGSELYIELDNGGVNGISKFHANILGWSEDEDYQQCQAIELAAFSRSVINPRCVDAFENYKKRELAKYTDKTRIKITVSPPRAVTLRRDK